MFHVYIGLRGSGKSSYAARISRKYIRKGYKVYSNFPLKGCYLYNSSDIGKFDISNCVLIFDEAGIDLNNRNYSSKQYAITPSARQWWKLTRHYNVDHIFVFSQALDFDITLRRLADVVHIITKGWLPHFSHIYTLKNSWDNDNDGQPVIKYEVPFLFLPFFRAPYYKFFDSYSAPDLPKKDFTFVE